MMQRKLCMHRRSYASRPTFQANENEAVTIYFGEITAKAAI
jgi:hypothetical protein